MSRVLQVPVDSQSSVLLEVTVFTPSGPDPFPLVIMNHGAAGSSMRPDQMERYRFSFSSYYFLSRGYAVALPMMLGYAGSAGRQISSGCNQESMGRANARDIDAVLDSWPSNRASMQAERSSPARASVAGTRSPSAPS